jgi:3-deoxy-D-manno-octulosonate 8-phosphate phosphatase (KDO 8-P phosphatase)
MYTNLKVNFNDIDIFIFDFDGVLTPNTVFIDQNGKESVQCSRSDGLAFDVLNKLNKVSYIVSTEKNSVVAARAKKLNILSMQKVENKLEAIKTIVNKHESDLKRVLFVGNDLNDYYAMKSCGLSVCPLDSHLKIKNLADITLKSYGGHGVVRELLEEVFKLDFIQILYI